MNKRIKKLWVEALRSGKYKQTQGQLRKGDSFCCLGVLCNLHAQEHPDMAKRQRSKHHYMGNAGTLPQEVTAWAGLPFQNPLVSYRRQTGTLAEFNDNGKSFAFIANAIDKNL